MSLPDILFKGVPRRFTRGYTLEVIQRHGPDRVIIPCVGAFALATTAVEAGIRPEQIEACDISLYTTVIGYYLAGKDLPLRAKGEFEWLSQYMVDPLGKVAAVALGIRLLQYMAKRPSLYQKERIRELVERQDSYVAQLRKAGEHMHARLGGISYEAEDMWALLGRNQEPDQKTLILCNPPRYEGGYSKMYEGIDDAFDWAQPNVKQFGEAQYVPLVNYLSTGPKCLIYYATPVATAEDPADEWGKPWTSVFAHRPKTGAQAAINWIVANWNEKKQLQRADVEPRVRAKFKLFREGAITKDSDLRVQVESKEVASYYRDLFVHNLGHLNAERYKVLLLDGKLVATLGLHLQNLRAGGSMAGVAKLRFAFSVDHPDYPKIHKLTLLSVVSSWFWEGELSDIEPPPRSVQTTMLTPHPETKTARGIFKLTDREKDKDTGLFKLTYYADVVDRTPEETLAIFLSKWAG
jgi:hypothetical protein